MCESGWKECAVPKIMTHMTKAKYVLLYDLNSNVYKLTSSREEYPKALMNSSGGSNRAVGSSLRKE